MPASQGGAGEASAGEVAPAGEAPFDEDVCLEVLAPEHRKHGEGEGDEGDEDEAGTAGDQAAAVVGVDFVQPDENTLRFVCLVDIYRESERGGVYTIGVIGRRGPKWVALEGTTYTYEQYQADEDDPENMAADASASIELVAIAPTENAVVSRLKWSESGLEHSQSVEEENLFRVTESGWQILLSLESRAGGSEVGSAEISQTFEIARDRQTLGYYDIEVTRSHEETIYLGEEGQTSETSEAWYRWDGDTYVEAEP